MRLPVGTFELSGLSGALAGTVLNTIVADALAERSPVTSCITVRCRESSPFARTRSPETASAPLGSSWRNDRVTVECTYCEFLLGPIGRCLHVKKPANVMSW